MLKSFFSFAALIFFTVFFQVAQCNGAENYDPVLGEYLLKDGEYLLRHMRLNGDLIELNDGSQFEVIGTDDSETVQEWRVGDKLLIAASYQLFSFSKRPVFNIKNVKEEESVSAYFSRPAPKNHALVKTISPGGIDRDYGEIYLQDGAGNETLWQVNKNDIKILQTWGYIKNPLTKEKIWDPILIGTNESESTFGKTWQNFFDQEMHILINYAHLETAPYVRARMIQEEE